MRTPTLSALTALLLVPMSATALADAPLTLRPGSRLWIEGTSTVRKFQCTAAVLEADIIAAPAAVPAILSGEKAVRSVEVRIPTARLDCANGTMNEHMLKALKAKEHATITFVVASYETERAADEVRGMLAGTLSLGGVKKTITVNATGRGAAEGALRVTGAHELRMSDYGLKPPTLMLGTMKVGDAVNVRFDLLLKGEPTVAANQ